MNSAGATVQNVNPTDGKWHRYFCDFLIQVKTSDGTLKTYLVEIKPDAQTRPPVPGKKSKKTFLTEVLTWAKNDAKWKAAREYCKKINIEFVILTEHDLKV